MAANSIQPSAFDTSSLAIHLPGKCSNKFICLLRIKKTFLLCFSKHRWIGIMQKRILEKDILKMERIALAMDFKIITNKSKSKDFRSK